MWEDSYQKSWTKFCSIIGKKLLTLCVYLKIRTKGLKENLPPAHHAFWRETDKTFPFTKKFLPPLYSLEFQNKRRGMRRDNRRFSRAKLFSSPCGNPRFPHPFSPSSDVNCNPSPTLEIPYPNVIFVPILKISNFWEGNYSFSPPLICSVFSITLIQYRYTLHIGRYLHIELWRGK